MSAPLLEVEGLDVRIDPEEPGGRPVRACELDDDKTPGLSKARSTPWILNVALGNG